MPLPLFSGQEIETKTGKAVYGSPKMDARRETAIGTGKQTATNTGKQVATAAGKETVIAAGVSSGAIIPQSSAEIPETAQRKRK